MDEKEKKSLARNALKECDILFQYFIKVRYIGPTNHREARVKVFSPDDRSVTLSFSYEIGYKPPYYAYLGALELNPEYAGREMATIYTGGKDNYVIFI
jgi:hypothetical protein